MKSPTCLTLCSLLLLFAADSWAQYGSRDNRAKNYLDGNRVRTVFYNYGLLGNVGEASFEWPQSTANEYMGDLSPLLGIKFIHPSGDTLSSVCTPYGPRGAPDGPPGGGSFWGFEPLAGFHHVEPGQTAWVAMSDDPATWPESWGNSWFGPYWGAGQWADQEAYFQMDDHADREWRVRGQDTLFPFPQDTTRAGLGLRVEARYLAFDDAQLEDMIFLHYILRNEGTVEVLAASFGVLAGMFPGGRMDSNDDLIFFDSTANAVFFFDSDDIGSPGWVPVNDSVNVGTGGVFFLKSPGDQGITSFDFFTPPGALRVSDDHALWNRLVPGWIDANVSFPSDCDFVMGTGHFALGPGLTDTVIVGIVFGIDADDVTSKLNIARDLFANGQIMTAPPERKTELPSEFTLGAYPNPFNAALTISLSSFPRGQVAITLYDVKGRTVAHIFEGLLERSVLHYTAPPSMATGTYFVRAQTVQGTAMTKVVLLK